MTALMKRRMAEKSTKFLSFPARVFPMSRIFSVTAQTVNSTCEYQMSLTSKELWRQAVKVSAQKKS